MSFRDDESQVKTEVTCVNVDDNDDIRDDQFDDKEIHKRKDDHACLSCSLRVLSVLVCILCPCLVCCIVSTCAKGSEPKTQKSSNVEGASAGQPCPKSTFPQYPPDPPPPKKSAT